MNDEERQILIRFSELKEQEKQLKLELDTHKKMVEHILTIHETKKIRESFGTFELVERKNSVLNEAKLKNDFTSDELIQMVTFSKTKAKECLGDLYENYLTEKDKTIFVKFS